MAFSTKASTTYDQDIKKAMQNHNVEGTMIIKSEDGNITYVYNKQRANTELTPGSTFKIPNSIIALEENIIKDQYEVIKWDGKKRFLKVWDQDHNLKLAFKHSCVWFYQRLAKKIGKEKYLEYFKKLSYGNQLLGADVTKFWLIDGGELRITPYQQLNFLRSIYHKQLPISARTYNILRNIMLEESTTDYQLYSKTGLAKDHQKKHGWYVGYIVSKGKTWFFVTNIFCKDSKDYPKRKMLTIAVLKKKGII